MTTRALLACLLTLWLGFVLGFAVGVYPKARRVLAPLVCTPAP